MQMITVSGPPSAGKTSVILKAAACLRDRGCAVGVVKFDCLFTDDDQLYAAAGFPAKKALSRELCPDHFFISNIEDAWEWGEKKKLDYLITESAGLCNRCSPHIRQIMAVCVVDQLSGIRTPAKIGPMLRLADEVVVTKGDIVSQAEREVFETKVRTVNPRAEILHVNGLNGQGAQALADAMQSYRAAGVLKEQKLRFPMPMALCSYCLGETKIGAEYQIGNLRKADWGDEA